MMSIKWVQLKCLIVLRNRMYGRKWEGLLVKVMRLVDLEVVVDIVDGIRDYINAWIQVKIEF